MHHPHRRVRRFNTTERRLPSKNRMMTEMWQRLTSSQPLVNNTSVEPSRHHSLPPTQSRKFSISISPGSASGQTLSSDSAPKIYSDALKDLQAAYTSITLENIPPTALTTAAEKEPALLPLPVVMLPPLNLATVASTSSNMDNNVLTSSSSIIRSSSSSLSPPSSPKTTWRTAIFTHHLPISLFTFPPEATGHVRISMTGGGGGGGGSHPTSSSSPLVMSSSSGSNQQYTLVGGGGGAGAGIYHLTYSIFPADHFHLKLTVGAGGQGGAIGQGGEAGGTSIVEIVNCRTDEPAVVWRAGGGLGGGAPNFTPTSPPSPIRCRQERSLSASIKVDTLLAQSLPRYISSSDITKPLNTCQSIPPVPTSKELPLDISSSSVILRDGEGGRGGGVWVLTFPSCSRGRSFASERVPGSAGGTRQAPHGRGGTLVTEISHDLGGTPSFSGMLVGGGGGGCGPVGHGGSPAYLIPHRLYSRLADTTPTTIASNTHTPPRTPRTESDTVAPSYSSSRISQFEPNCARRSPLGGSPPLYYILAWLQSTHSSMALAEHNPSTGLLEEAGYGGRGAFPGRAGESGKEGFIVVEYEVYI